MPKNVKSREIEFGSSVIGEAVKACRPGVVPAFPITPQTHIVEYISQLIADGKLKSEYILGDSEFSVASILYGASSTGVRSYTATASQGFLLMHEVLFNMAGSRVPTVITAVNRSLSPPINIQLDHQDTLSLRDPGIIQIYTESIQEAYNTHIQAFKISEHNDVMLPVIVGCDGFIISHCYEPVSYLEQDSIDEFLPDYEFSRELNSREPLTHGSLGGSENIMEFRYMVEQALENSKSVIKDVAKEFDDMFGMYFGGLIDEYKTDDAEIILIAMGSMVGTMKEAVDIIREETDYKVGVVKIRAYRPFPEKEILKAIKEAEVVAVLDRNVSMGLGGIVGSEIKSCLYNQNQTMPPIISYIAGLGGREINVDVIKRLVKDVEKRVENNDYPIKSVYFDLKDELILGSPSPELKYTKYGK